MKIAIPVDERDMTTICVSFGRAPYFMIYDTVSKEAVFLENSAASSPGGAGIQAAQFVVDQKVDALLTPRCGQNAADVIKGAGVKIYKTLTPSIQETLKALDEGKLGLLDEVHPGFHHHGGN